MIPLLLALVFSCNSTIFAYPGDKHAGGKSRYLKRKVHHTDVGIAHRTLPLGTTVTVCNQRTGLCGSGVVLDRGPYGMVDERGWFNARLERDRAKRWLGIKGHRAYRGCADLTPGLAKIVGHDGFDRVTIRRQ